MVSGLPFLKKIPVLRVVFSNATGSEAPSAFSKAKGSRGEKKGIVYFCILWCGKPRVGVGVGLLGSTTLQGQRNVVVRQFRSVAPMDGAIWVGEVLVSVGLSGGIGVSVEVTEREQATGS